ncbi:MAG TPA: exodeoxyribonuclease VII large subunit [Candidatus Paceibacterota bacterium]
MQESFFDRSENLQLENDGDGNVVYSVAQCVGQINEAVGRLGVVRVRGEISALSQSRGAMAFFDLKDASGKEYVLQCSIFGWSFSKYKHFLEDGLEVVVHGKLKVYEKRGSLSFIADSIEPSGEGAWRKAFEELKKRLGAKGYFDESRKRQLPLYIQKIGLITSEDGQALHDFRQNLGNYGFSILLYPVWVEGDKAEASIVKALQWFNKNKPDMDALVLIRGGGGFENLKVFNSEKIADAIVSSRIPVITGIGHEKDESIADYVADKHLSTPTAVAAFLKARREDVMRGLDMLWEGLQEGMQDIIKEERLLVNTQAERLHRGFGKVFEGFANLKQRLVRARYAYEKQVYVYLASVERAQSMLTSLNPENVLQRGYSIAFNSRGETVKSIEQIEVGETAMVKVWKGKFSALVERKFK